MNAKGLAIPYSQFIELYAYVFTCVQKRAFDEWDD